MVRLSLPSSSQLGEYDREVLCVLLVEGSVRMAAALPTLIPEYIIPYLSVLNEPMYTEADGKGRRTRLTTHLRCGIVVYPTDMTATTCTLSSINRSSVVTRMAFTDDIDTLPERLLSLFDSAASTHTSNGDGRLANGNTDVDTTTWAHLPGGGGHAPLVEGLVGALELYQEYTSATNASSSASSASSSNSSNNDGATTTTTASADTDVTGTGTSSTPPPPLLHCLLLADAVDPQPDMPCRWNVHQKYDDWTLSMAMDELRLSNVHLSLIATHTRVPALIELVSNVNKDRVPLIAHANATRKNRVVQLAGIELPITPPTPEFTSNLVNATANGSNATSNVTANGTSTTVSDVKPTGLQAVNHETSMAMQGIESTAALSNPVQVASTTTTPVAPTTANASTANATATASSSQPMLTGSPLAVQPVKEEPATIGTSTTKADRKSKAKPPNSGSSSSKRKASTQPASNAGLSIIDSSAEISGTGTPEDASKRQKTQNNATTPVSSTKSAIHGSSTASTPNTATMRISMPPAVNPAIAASILGQVQPNISGEAGQLNTLSTTIAPPTTSNISMPNIAANVTAAAAAAASNLPGSVVNPNNIGMMSLQQQQQAILQNMRRESINNNNNPTMP
ncbi:hypothetical protein BDF22DRAFT_733375, partial [Syncephalis plumigaleata]